MTLSTLTRRKRVLNADPPGAAEAVTRHLQVTTGVDDVMLDVVGIEELSDGSVEVVG